MSSVASTPAGPEAELPELQHLIEQHRFEDALAACDRLLVQFPAHRDLLYMRAVALRHLQRVPEALATLDLLEDAHPAYPRLFQERGHCHVFLRQAPEAIRAFSRAVELNPALPASWRLLTSLYKMVGRTQESANAAQHVAKLASLATEVVTARSMLADGNLREAEELIRGYLQRKPDDIEALRVLAQVAQRNEFAKDAATLLEAVLKASPGYRAARHDYVLALIDLHRHKQAHEQLDLLIAAEPDNPSHRMNRAAILVSEGSTEAAIALYEELARQQPDNPEVHLSLGHALKTQGRRADAESAYRKAARLRANFGDAFLSLANLNT
jgi:predicted Zn-dependent protease